MFLSCHVLFSIGMMMAAPEAKGKQSQNGLPYGLHSGFLGELLSPCCATTGTNYTWEIHPLYPWGLYSSQVQRRVALTIFTNFRNIAF